MRRDYQALAITLLRQTTLFGNADAGMLEQCIEHGGNIRVFAHGETVFSDKHFSPELGLILSGKANVKKGRAVISTLEKGSVFGAVTLFGKKQNYATEITASSSCKVLFLTREAVAQLMARDSKIAENYIAYLSERIYFLTDKIDAFTAGSAEDRLANWLANNILTDSTGSRFALAGNLSLLARELDIGRASLYRAFDCFEAEGTITREGKKIIILDKTKLVNKN
jgi:CRP/FNR family transcriptional regulator, dissimilatory nitrate respiration regulator